MKLGRFFAAAAPLGRRGCIELPAVTRPNLVHDYDYALLGFLRLGDYTPHSGYPSLTRFGSENLKKEQRLW